MLESLDTLDAQWSLLPIRARVPTASQRESAQRSSSEADKRRFYRHPCLGKVILEADEERFAAYVVDVSRSGLAIVAPVELRPSQRVYLTTVTGRFRVHVIHCLRLGTLCYRCGCRFQRRADDVNTSS